MLKVFFWKGPFPLVIYPDIPKNGYPLEFNHTEIKCDLTIEFAVDQDNGEWTCELGGFTATYNLTVEAKPTKEPIKTIEKEIIAGDAVTLDCQGPPSEFCGWKGPLYQEIFPEEPKTGYTLDFNDTEGKCDLTIDFATNSDHGEWKCTLKDFTIIYYVTVTPKPTKEPIKTIEKEVIAGDAVTLECRGSPSVFCRWKGPLYQEIFHDMPKNGYPLDFNEAEGKCDLTIDFATNSDEGEWKCNLMGNIVLYYITVKPRPTKPPVVITEYEVNIDGTVTLKCHGTPTDFCSWKGPSGKEVFHDEPKIGYPLEFNATAGKCDLTIIFATIHDIGEWRCTLRHYTETYYVTVKESPTKSPVEAIDRIVNLAQSTILMCRGTATHFCGWKGPSHKTIFHDHAKTGYPLNFNGTEGKCDLVILSMTEADSGEWQCVLKNYTIVYYLIGEQNPTTGPVKTVERIMDLGDSVILQCRGLASDVCGWKGPLDQEIFTHKPNASYPLEFEPSKGKCDLTIENVTEADSGEWQCDQRHQTVVYYVTANTPTNESNETIDKEILVGDPVTLECQGPTSDYCGWKGPLHQQIFHDEAKCGYPLDFNETEGKCDLTIENTTDIDVGQWKCTLRNFTMLYNIEAAPAEETGTSTMTPTTTMKSTTTKSPSRNSASLAKPFCLCVCTLVILSLIFKRH